MNQSASEILTLDIVHWRAFPVSMIMLSGDLLSFGLAFFMAATIRGKLVSVFGSTLHGNELALFFLTNLVCLLAVYWSTGLYPGHGFNAIEEIRQIFFSLFLGYSLLGMMIYLLKLGSEFPRMVFITSWIFSFIFNTIIRLAIHKWVAQFKWWGVPTAIITPTESTTTIIHSLQQNYRLGFRPVLALDDNFPTATGLISDVPVLRSRKEFISMCQRYRIQSVLHIEVSNPTPSTTLSKENQWLVYHFRTLLIVPSTAPQGTLWARTVDLDGKLLFLTRFYILMREYSLVKRSFDLFIGIILSVILTPLGVLIALLIRLDSQGPVFFIQERLGLHGKPFRYIKFRTMVDNADQLLDEILENHPQAREEFQQHHKLRADPRITRIGRMLRRYSLDEIPQLWHVLKGEMSLVGPRAYIPFEYAGMGEHADLILRIRPGITGWWQVMGRHSTTFSHRLQLDEYYVYNWSVWLDFYILIKTVWVLLRGYGV